ncbi:hypothetical protein VB779_14535 [Haloarculaceae archaeon H-GB11]|nr:hypothetical protein [Haloarculaceae archaeon H-GB11]
MDDRRATGDSSGPIDADLGGPSRHCRSASGLPTRQSGEAIKPS